MKIFKILAKKREKKLSDPNQESVDKNGRDQIQKLVEKGISFKIIGTLRSGF